MIPKPDNWNDYIDWKHQFIIDHIPIFHDEIRKAERAGDEPTVLKFEQYLRVMEEQALVPDEYVPDEFETSHARYKKDHLGQG